MLHSSRAIFVSGDAAKAQRDPTSAEVGQPAREVSAWVVSAAQEALHPALERLSFDCLGLIGQVPDIARLDKHRSLREPLIEVLWRKKVLAVEPST